MAPLLEASNKRRESGMSEETKQQNICSAVFLLSRLHVLKGGGGKAESSVYTWAEAAFLTKDFSSSASVLNFKLQSYLY